MLNAPFSWDDLHRWKADGRFLDGVADHYRTFWSPLDDVHGLLVALLGSARHSVVLNMYGLTDPDLAALLDTKLQDPAVYVQVSLDSTQAAGKTEAEVLAQFRHDAPANSVAVGQSSKHAISHLKILLIDGIYTVSGSTNWSLGGEEKQDNELTLSRDPVRAAEFRAVLDRNHDYMLKAAAAKRSAA